jgi:hypothetical protein
MIYCVIMSYSFENFGGHGGSGGGHGGFGGGRGGSKNFNNMPLNFNSNRSNTRYQYSGSDLWPINLDSPIYSDIGPYYDYDDYTDYDSYNQYIYSPYDYRYYYPVGNPYFKYNGMYYPQNVIPY